MRPRQALPVIAAALLAAWLLLPRHPSGAPPRETPIATQPRLANDQATREVTGSGTSEGHARLPCA